MKNVEELTPEELLENVQIGHEKICRFADVQSELNRFNEKPYKPTFIPVAAAILGFFLILSILTNLPIQTENMPMQALFMFLFLVAMIGGDGLTGIFVTEDRPPN